MLRTLHRVAQYHSRRALFSTEPFLPKITERRVNEQGAGGRQSDAGVKVAIFGATGFLGKHLCYQLGTFDLLNFRLLMNFRARSADPQLHFLPLFFIVS